MQDNNGYLPKKAKLVASWNFTKKEENKNSLLLTGNIDYFNKGNFSGVNLDGCVACLSTSVPILNTSKSFSITAWVKINSKLVNGTPILKEDEWARTAISQNCTTHSVFYLGVRRIAETDNTTSIKWSFTIAPIDGRETGKFDWCRANSSTVVDEKFLDKWVFLVGVLDTEERIVKLYVPSLNEIGIKSVPDGWDFWETNEGLQIGRSRWLENDLDYWPGSIGPIRAYSGILTDEEINKIYYTDLENYQPYVS
jgi:hypothetical protein